MGIVQSDSKDEYEYEWEHIIQWVEVDGERRALVQWKPTWVIESQFSPNQETQQAIRRSQKQLGVRKINNSIVHSTYI